MQLPPSPHHAEFGPAAEVIHPAGGSGLLLVCEHASHAIPAPLDGLGLSDAARLSHAAWDIGALSLARRLSARLDAPLVAGLVSRLVYDCNRPPDARDAIPVRSEWVDVPGNVDLTPAARAARVAGVHDPFHDAVAAACDRLAARVAAPVFVTVHSFTPVFAGLPRDVQLGLLHGADDRLARAMLARSAETGWQCALNQPYGPADGVLHTIDRHATPRGWMTVMIEVRNDLIATSEGVADVAPKLAALLQGGLADLGVTPDTGA